MLQFEDDALEAHIFSRCWADWVMTLTMHKRRRPWLAMDFPRYRIGSQLSKSRFLWELFVKVTLSHLAETSCLLLGFGSS